MIFRAKVLRSRALTPSTHAIEVEKPAGFRFRPVQFCGVELATSEGVEEYPMSLATSPTRPNLEWAARLSDSPWKRAFAALKPGDEVEIDGPYGHFLLDEARDAVFVGGGIGITPLKGMMEFMADAHSPHRGTLVYSNRDAGEIAYRAELDALVAAHANLRVVHTLTREPEGSSWRGRRGRLDAEVLREAAEGMRDPAFYLCGKPDMVRGAFEALVANGVPEARIVYELFPGYG